MHVEQLASVCDKLGVFLGNFVAHDDRGGHWLPWRLKGNTTEENSQAYDATESGAVDNSLPRMPARIVVTEPDQVMHAVFAHVSERHRRAGWVIGFMTGVLA
jgi:hypothetical protein